MGQLVAFRSQEYEAPADQATDPIVRPAQPNTLASLFIHSAMLNTDRPALWADGALVTYSELLDLAGRIANALIDAGLGNGTGRCAVLGDRGLVDFTGVLGALLARNTYVPLNIRHPLQRLATSLQAADVHAMVVSPNATDIARHLLDTVAHGILVLLPDSATVPDWAHAMPRHRFLCRDDLRPADIDAIPAGSPEDGAYLLFTSGTTGAPKGVLVRNRNVIPYMRWAADRYAPGPDDRCTQLFDLTFDLSVHDMFVCWSAGASLFRVPGKAKFAPRDFIRRNALTMWFSVPSTTAMMLGLRMLRPDDFPSLRLSLFCGEALPKRLASAWATAAPNSLIENIYGPTEATIAITAFRLPRDQQRFDALPEVVPIGSAFTEQHALLVDADGQKVPLGEEGELCLAGSQVTDGYWQRPDLTSQRFVRFPWDASRAIWYRTGDRARLTREHGIVFLGRLDRQVKIAGHRCELQEIEAVLHRAAGANAAAIAWPLGPDGLARGIVGCVGHTAQPNETIIDACRQALPPYAVPSAIHRVDDWPVNASGKTDHARLRQIVETNSCQQT